jgi:hypothetical protein
MARWDSKKSSHKGSVAGYCTFVIATCSLFLTEQRFKMAPRLPNHSPVARLNESEANTTSKSAHEEHEEAVERKLPAAPTLMPASNMYDNPMMMGGSSMMYNGGGAYGGMSGFGGMGALGGMGAGMMGSSYYGGGMGGPFSGLNQFLFGVQNVISSLGQAVQIIGMNTQALSQLLESGTTMVDHAIATWHEMQTIDQRQRSRETEEEKKRRRRLRALRWALVVGVSFAVTKLVRYILQSSRRKRLTASSSRIPASSPYSSAYSTAPPNAYSDPYHGGAAHYGGSPYGGYSPYGN